MVLLCNSEEEATSLCTSDLKGNSEGAWGHVETISLSSPTLVISQENEYLPKPFQHFLILGAIQLEVQINLTYTKLGGGLPLLPLLVVGLGN